MTKQIIRVATIQQEDLPNAATHCSQGICGFSIYRGVLVQWDEDHDTRVLDMLDEFPEHLLERLLVVQEHEGTVSFVWTGSVPEGWDRGSISVGGDCWSIHASTALPGPLVKPGCGSTGLTRESVVEALKVPIITGRGDPYGFMVGSNLVHAHVFWSNGGDEDTDKSFFSDGKILGQPVLVTTRFPNVLFALTRNEYEKAVRNEP